MRAQDAPRPGEDIDRFYLFGSCRPMSVIAYDGQSWPERFKMSKGVIEVGAR
ncbi:MAG: hypothetical protein OXJ56_10095 [Rhodospirillaceae bacterium]|nr:hypothetical protein [Rhodospirillaceae bacterium]